MTEEEEEVVVEEEEEQVLRVRTNIRIRISIKIPIRTCMCIRICISILLVGLAIHVHRVHTFGQHLRVAVGLVDGGAEELEAAHVRGAFDFHAALRAFLGHLLEPGLSRCN